MDYPLIANETIIHNPSQLCQYLVRVHHEARHEDSPDLPELCTQFGITEYVVSIQPEPEIVYPEEITRRQGDMILEIYDLYDTIQGIINDGVTLTKIQYIEAKAASCYRRDNPLLVAVTAAAGMSDYQLKVMFLQGSLL